MTEGDMVGDLEVLYRRIRFDWAVMVEGRWRLTSQAFNDRNWKPSVNRQTLLPDPADSKQEETDGLVQLISQEVRAVAGILHNPNARDGEPRITYRLDVIPRPIQAGNADGLPENPAHAQIESAPTVETRTRFDKIKEALGRLAEQREWVIQPTPPAG